MKARAALFLALLSATAHAGPRTSTNYSITIDTVDGGGQRATSSSSLYTNDGSAGSVVGISSVASPAETAKDGYIGQLYEVAGLVVSASPATVNETATLQLSASQLLDDTSSLAVNATSVTWSVLSGPITGISTAGLATAGAVPQNTAASVQGIFGGFTGSLNLTVLDTIPDNYGSYAGDGIDDAWQMQYFGQNNPQAAPGYVSDGSGLTNLFKYIAGLIPGNAASRFILEVNPAGGQPGQFNIVFTPSLTDRNYTVQYKENLTDATWSILAGPFAGNGSTQTVTDPTTIKAHRFYQVQVTKP